MIKKQIRLERSPFHKYREMTAPRGSENLQTQVSKDIYDDFINFAIAYNVQNDVPKTKQGTTNKATPLKHIINEFLNNNALKYQSFKQLHVIMAFNQIDFNDPHVNGAVIGFIEHPYKKPEFKQFQAVPNRSNTLYKFRDFKDVYDELHLEIFDREVLFDIPVSEYVEFETVREHLQELHEDIDFDNAVICMFELNNYLDIMSDGVCKSKTSKYEHEGFIVILNPDDISMFDRVIARILWSYNAGLLCFKFDVVDNSFFHNELINNVHVLAQKDYIDISGGLFGDKKGLEIQLQSSNNRIEELEKQLADEKQRNSEIQNRIDESEH